MDVRVGHDASHVGPADIVAVSTAIPSSNPEVGAARERGIRVARRAEILAAIVATRPAVAVGGTHGKTTTSSMLSLVLMEAGLHPSFIVGGELNEIGTGAVWDPRGELLVVEADESDGTFIELPAESVLVTNVEPDHIEHYGSFEALRAAFELFVEQASRARVVCVDDPLAAALAAGQRAVGYGTSQSADYRMIDVVTGHGRVTFVLETPSGERWPVVLPVPGLHNARNAAGAMAMALELGVSGDAAVRALGRYAGVARRFEIRGTAAGVTFVDEYSHLPSEVAAAIEAATEGEWRRVVCVFQPHRFSRTATLWQDFADAFVGADVLAVTDVYSAGETPRPGITGKLIVNAVLDEHPMQRVAWLPHRADLVSYLEAELRARRSVPHDGRRGPHHTSRRAPRSTHGEGGLMSAAVEAAATRLGVLATRDAPFGELTTYRVGGRAALSVIAADLADLATVTRVRQETGVDVVVMGRGSNTLVADRGFDGLLVMLGEGFATIEIEGTTVRAGGAASLPVVARTTATAGLRGFEWAVGVPGSVGGAVRMNAGGHGSDMAAVLERVRAMDLESGKDVVVPATELDLGYRRSALTATDVVVWAELGLRRGDAAEAEEEIAAIVRWRRANQPGGQNAGSVFTNPAGDSAGRLVDATGLKGFRIGTARVSEKHANFIQADDGGSADDVLALMRAVVDRVRDKHGVVLQPEVRLVGFP